MIKHTIFDISFARNWLQCICGWEGVALELQPYYLHRKEAPLLDESFIQDKKYKGTFIKRKSAVI